MIKASKFRIYPTLAQRRQLSLEFGARRRVWNWALGRRSSAYKADKTRLNAVALSRELTALKTSDTFLASGSATALNNTLWDLDEAYSRFFAKTAKYPRFKKYGSVNSTCYALDKRRGAGVFQDGARLSLPKLGALRVKWTQPVVSFPNSATVSHDAAGRWYVSLQHAGEDQIYPEAPSGVIGLDLGIKDLVTISDGTKIKPPRFMRKAERRLAHAQRVLSRKRRGSGNRRKARSRVARIHQRIGDQRNDFLHKLSTTIVGLSKVVAIEDLNVRGVMANGKLSSAVADCGWYELRRQLTYKTEWRGQELVVIPQFQRTTGVCPNCGHVGDKLSLGVRAWSCLICGSEHDRDIAAARVIRNIGFTTARSAGINACGLVNKQDDSGASHDNTGRKEAGKAQRASPQGCGQRTPRFQGARLRA